MPVVRWRPDEGRVEQVVTMTEAGRMLAAAGAADGVWWIDVGRDEVEDGVSLARDLGAAGERVGEIASASRPGVRVDGAHAALALPAVGSDGAGVRREMLVMATGPGWVLTVGRPPAGPSAQVVAAVEARLPATRAEAPDVLALMVDELVDQAWDVSDDLDDRLTAAEQASLNDADALRVTLQALRHDILVLHRATGPVRRIVAALTEAPSLGVDARRIGSLRQSHDAVVELRGQLDTQLLLLNGLSQTQVLAASHRANDVMQATSSWGAILVVATLITGIYGMNFRTMPELSWPLGYPFAIALIVGATAILYRLFRSRGWL